MIHPTGSIAGEKARASGSNSAMWGAYRRALFKLLFLRLPTNCSCKESGKVTTVLGYFFDQVWIICCFVEAAILGLHHKIFYRKLLAEDLPKAINKRPLIWASLYCLCSSQIRLESPCTIEMPMKSSFSNVEADVLKPCTGTQRSVPTKVYAQNTRFELSIEWLLPIALSVSHRNWWEAWCCRFMNKLLRVAPGYSPVSATGTPHSLFILLECFKRVGGQGRCRLGDLQLFLTWQNAPPSCQEAVAPEWCMTLPPGTEERFFADHFTSMKNLAKPAAEDAQIRQHPAARAILDPPRQAGKPFLSWLGRASFKCPNCSGNYARQNRTFWGSQ